MSESALLIDPVSKEYDLVYEKLIYKKQRERLVDITTLYSILGLQDPESVFIPFYIDYSIGIR